MIREIKEKGSLTLELRCDAGGLALYGRNSGRFALDIELLAK